MFKTKTTDLPQRALNVEYHEITQVGDGQTFLVEGHLHKYVSRQGPI